MRTNQRRLGVSPIHLDYDFEIPNHWSFWICVLFNYLIVGSLIANAYLRNTYDHPSPHTSFNCYNQIPPSVMIIDPSKTPNQPENALDNMHSQASPEPLPAQHAIGGT